MFLKNYILIIILIIIINNNNNNGLVQSRYISYSKPNYYTTNQLIPVYMNNIRSGLSIYDYNKYPFPKPSKIEYTQSFTSKLAGDLKSTSIYDNVKMNLDIYGHSPTGNCSTMHNGINVTYTKADIETLKYLIDKNFRINFFIDDLPIGELFKNHRTVDHSDDISNSNSISSDSSITESKEVEVGDHIYLGYPVGFKFQGKYYLYTHLKIFINSTESKEETDIQSFYIQSVNVEPYSLNGPCNWNDGPMEINEANFLNPLKPVQYSYNVITSVSHGKIEERWLIYYVNQIALTNTAIIGSVLVVLATSFCLTIILLKIFKKTSSINRVVSSGVSGSSPIYTQLSPDDGGWKSIYADVFRSPNNYMTFSIIVGFGVQIAAASFILMVFSVAGLTSIATPGGMAIASILIFAFTGLFNGYSSMRTYIMLGGTRKLYNSVVTSIFLPFIVLFLSFVGYFQIWSNKYTYGASVGTVFFILMMWLLVSVPCSLIASYFVRQWPPAEYPVRTNPIPRFIPPHKWYQNPYLHMLLGGAIPFFIIFLELSFFLSSWVFGEHYSYSLSFCFTFILMIISIIQTNMILEYYQLSLENYNWWWRSLIGPSATGLYTFIYFIYFGATRFTTSGVWFYYFMFSLVFSILISLFCSSIGFLGNLWFTKKIYSTLHFD